MKKKKLTIKETFALALQHHQKNNLQAAEQLYKQILEVEPDHVESIFRLGSLLIQTKNFFHTRAHAKQSAVFVHALRRQKFSKI